jgi:hypothetical protein
MQHAMVCENWAKDNKSYSRFKEVSTKEKHGVNYVDEASYKEEESEVCVAEWVDVPRDKPLMLPSAISYLMCSCRIR